LAELGKQLLDTINEMNKQATAGTATGKPGADTHYTSVSKETEHVDKNNQGKPEHNPQEVKQHPASDPSDPTKTHHKAAEVEQPELDKEASFELGRQFARTFLMSKTASQVDLYKEAGSRDFEQLIAQAAAELEKESKVSEKSATQQLTNEKVAEVNKQAEEEALQIKQAEEAGAQSFYALVKQAQEEEQANQVKLAVEQQINKLAQAKEAAEAKVAELAAKLATHEAEMQKKAEEDKLDAKLAQWGRFVVEDVITKLKQTTA
jgi:hypothetical protein